MGKAAKKGAIIKGGAYVEEMSRIDTIVIDKTGTLTFGDPVVTEITGFDGFTQKQVLESAVLAERRSNHPFAKAILNKAAELGVTPPSSSGSSSTYIPGKGIVSEYAGGEILVGNSVLMKERNVQLPKQMNDFSN